MHGGGIEPRSVSREGAAERYGWEKLQELAEKELEEIERLKREMEESLAENTKKMYEMSREYKQAQEEKDAKRHQEMKARLQVRLARRSTLDARPETLIIALGANVDAPSYRVILYFFLIFLFSSPSTRVIDRFTRVDPTGHARVVLIVADPIRRPSSPRSASSRRSSRLSARRRSCGSARPCGSREGRTRRSRLASPPSTKRRPPDDWKNVARLTKTVAKRR